MKIAHVISYFQPEFGYEEYYMSREQAALGHDVHVITSDRIFPFRNVEKMLEEIGSPYGDRSRPEGVEEMEGFMVHRNPVFFEILYDYLVFRNVPECLERIKPDVVHAHGFWTWGTYQAARKKKDIGYRLVIDEHAYSTTYDQKRTFRNWLLDKEFRILRAPFGRYSLKKGDAFVAVSRETREFLRSFYGVDATTVPLGVDHRIFSKDPAAGRRIRKELGLEDRFVMITAGRLERAKRIEAFIRALKLIDSDDAAMIVVGQGDESYLEYLRSVSDDRVVFLGFRRPDELAALYSAADLGVWGKASITIREAMSCSLPLLLFDTGDMRSLIKWDNGIAVERDPKRIKDIMLELMEDVDLRKKLGDNGRKAVEEDLSVEAEAKRLLEIYRG